MNPSLGLTRDRTDFFLSFRKPKPRTASLPHTYISFEEYQPP